MEQLPKIVGQRLQAVSAGTHPDANLLAAFAEKSLLPREQASVLEHLAACTACREVVAFAQPEEIFQHVAAAPATARSMEHRSWFQGAVRWAALAACVVVVGTVVISRAHFSKNEKVASRSEPALVAQSEMPPAPSAPAVEPLEKSSNQKTAGLKDQHSYIDAKRDADQVSEFDKQVTPKTLPRVADERREDAVGIVAGANTSPVQTQTLEASRASASGSAAKAEEAKASKKEFSADKAMKAPAAANEVVQLEAAPVIAPSPSSPAADSVIANQRAKTSTGGSTAFYKSKDGFAQTETAIGGLAQSTVPRWQISAEGKLIKSSDLGKSWQTVPIGDKVIFRALCIADRDVWVGGANGNLFYSSNAGENWDPVKPSANGKTLTGDITAIAFTDPQHGKVVTTSHETWTTNDGGHVWQVETR